MELALTALPLVKPMLIYDLMAEVNGLLVELSHQWQQNNIINKRLNQFKKQLKLLIAVFGNIKP